MTLINIVVKKNFFCYTRRVNYRTTCKWRLCANSTNKKRYFWMSVLIANIKSGHIFSHTVTTRKREKSNILRNTQGTCVSDCNAAFIFPSTMDELSLHDIVALCVSTMRYNVSHVICSKNHNEMHAFVPYFVTHNRISIFYLISRDAKI